MSGEDLAALLYCVIVMPVCIGYFIVIILEDSPPNLLLTIWDGFKSGICMIRHFSLEPVLRRITGRQRPNYRLISELEQSLKNDSKR